jgi:MFS family permease
MVMNFLMTAAPLAMHLCGISTEMSDLGIQWHVVAMYGPSFFTGRLIARFGTTRVAAVGLGLLGAAAGAGLAGIQVAHFWSSLILLGLGWNFGFLGASAMVLECHRPEERTRVQSFNDFMVFGIMAVGSFSSGGLLTAYGWSTVLWVSFLPLLIAVAALGYRAMSQRAVVREASA